MKLREQFEKETENKLFDCSFGSVDRAYIQWLEQRLETASAVDTIVMYAVFKGDDLLEHTIRRTARECWDYFESFKKCDKSLLQRDEKEYGYKCKQIKVST